MGVATSWKGPVKGEWLRFKKKKRKKERRTTITSVIRWSTVFFFFLILLLVLFFFSGCNAGWCRWSWLVLFCSFFFFYVLHVFFSLDRAVSPFFFFYLSFITLFVTAFFFFSRAKKWRRCLVMLRWESTFVYGVCVCICARLRGIKTPTVFLKVFLLFFFFLLLACLSLVMYWQHSVILI